MPLISVPSEDSLIFRRYFECVWNMDADQDWQINYDRKRLIEEIMIECGYDSMAAFMMLTRAHDIIYDRDHE